MVAAAAFIGGIGAVAAADLGTHGDSLKDEPASSEPAFSWSGFYLGANAGYGRSKEDHAEFSTNFSPSDSAPNIGELSPSGAFGGGQIGYNFQHGNVVYGIEADFQGAGMDDDSPAAFGIAAGEFSTKVDWFGTVRGRLGIASGNALFYATGGFAYGSVEHEGVLSNGFLSAAFKNDKVETGWVVGGGVEYALSSNWTVKAEYQYLDLGSDSASGNVVRNDNGAPTGEVLRSDFDTNIHTVRVGVNYKFGSRDEPLK